MNIKKHLLTILFVTTTSIGFSQEYKKEIETQFKEYINYLINGEFEKSTDYIVPEFFEIIPKEQMIKLMEQTLNNPSMEFELKNPKIIEIKDAKQIEDKFYSLLSYSNQMNMKMKSEEEETEEEKETRINRMLIYFGQTFGQNNVKHNKETGFFEIQVEKRVCAISKNGQTNWKFLVLEKKQKPILEKILPTEIVTKI